MEHSAKSKKLSSQFKGKARYASGWRSDSVRTSEESG